MVLNNNYYYRIEDATVIIDNVHFLIDRPLSPLATPMYRDPLELETE